VSRLVWLVCCLLVAACSTDTVPPPSDPNPLLIEIGRKEFVRSCAACHGSDARGAGPAVPALRTAPPDLTGIASRRRGDFPADEIAAWIDGRMATPAHGAREMPIWGHRFAEGLPEGEMTQDLVRGTILTLVEYLRSIQVP
jgi:mono/diheme cytochrome c family protein